MIERSVYWPDLVHWVKEREAIRLHKERGEPPPWTDDPVMSTTRFCNVHREDDKVTKWIWKHYGVRNSRPPAHLQHALTIARLVNWPETLALLSYPTEGWDDDFRRHFINTFETMRRLGRKAWTGAYMVTGGYSKGGESKEVIIARVLDGAWERERVVHGDSLHTAASKIECPGIGNFLAAQVIADLKFSSILDKETTSDWWTWCAPGPGSMMGLNFLFGRPRTYHISNGRFIEEVEEVRDALMNYVPIYLDGQNTQNCLCELSKYIRVKYFKERMKNTYAARAEV